MFTYVQLAAVLVGSVVVGVAAHELSHVVALRVAGVPCSIEVVPSHGDGGQFSTGIGEPVARVTLTRPSEDVSPWALRIAALMPLCLALPLALIFVGILPDPFAAAELGPKMVLIGWLGCSIPSPQDFSLAWYPERALATADS